MAFLAIESATDVCSVAVIRHSETLFECTIDAPRRHAEMLAPLISDSLAALDASGGEHLRAVCVSGGPGSYTGLRIGVSSAKGVCFARGVPLVAVPTLHTFALTATAPEPRDGTRNEATSDVPSTILSLLHARADEWYGCVLRKDSNDESGGSLQELVESRVATIDEWLAVLDAIDQPTGASVMVTTPHSGRERLEPHRAQFLSRGIADVAAQPSALAVAHLGAAMASLDRYSSVETYEPAYLRAFVARTPKGSIFDRLSF